MQGREEAGGDNINACCKNDPIIIITKVFTVVLQYNADKCFLRSCLKYFPVPQVATGEKSAHSYYASLVLSSYNTYMLMPHSAVVRCRP